MAQIHANFIGGLQKNINFITLSIFAQLIPEKQIKSDFSLLNPSLFAMKSVFFPGYPWLWLMK
jgi:hypothetical protein